MIRPLTEIDLPQMIRVENLVQDFPWSEDIFKQCLGAGYRGFVLLQGKQLIGFIMFSLVASESHVLNLGVLPDFQHQGIGFQLLQHTLKWLKQNKAQTVYLEVRIGNLNAIALYTKAGFVEVATRSGYYPAKTGREDALVLAKDLRVDDEL